MKKLAVRNLRLCTKDCLCLYVCPTGAADTENSIIDPEKCVGCGLCVQRCVVSDPQVAIEIVRDYGEARRRIDEEQAKHVSNPWAG